MHQEPVDSMLRSEVNSTDSEYTRPGQERMMIPQGLRVLYTIMALTCAAIGTATLFKPVQEFLKIKDTLATPAIAFVAAAVFIAIVVNTQSDEIDTRINSSNYIE